MSKYVIHACPERMEYVMEYMLPSLRRQDIYDISVRCDTKHIGNLKSCMRIFASMPEAGGTWHLQDDVIICRDFKTRTEELSEDDIICGYAWTNDDNVEKVGYVKPQDMWWSFPCIHIPNGLARECADWFFNVAKDDPKYTSYVKQKKYDDYFFLEFLKEKRPDCRVLNLKPNLVDHIDYLLGFSVVNKERRHAPVRAKWFEDSDLVDELADKLYNKRF